MLRITIDLIPFGEEKNKKTISTLEIINTLAKNQFEEYTYSYKGWWQDTDDSIHKFNGRVEHDRRNFIYYLLYKIIIKIIEPFKYIF